MEKKVPSWPLAILACAKCANNPQSCSLSTAMQRFFLLPFYGAEDYCLKGEILDCKVCWSALCALKVLIKKYLKPQEFIWGKANTVWERDFIYLNAYKRKIDIKTLNHRVIPTDRRYLEPVMSPHSKIALLTKTLCFEPGGEVLSRKERMSQKICCAL
jgi:hypothetical protein